MAGRTTEDPSASYRQAFRAVQAADRLAHQDIAWDPHTTDTRLRAVFREFGRLRWLIVPLAGVIVALLVYVVGTLAGVPAQP